MCQRCKAGRPELHLAGDRPISNDGRPVSRQLPGWSCVLG